VSYAGADWSMTGGAAIANGNEFYYVGGSEDSRSLSLPAGASATSPAICVGPTIRSFVKRQSGGWLSLASVRVDGAVRDVDR